MQSPLNNLDGFALDLEHIRQRPWMYIGRNDEHPANGLLQSAILWNEPASRVALERIRITVDGAFVFEFQTPEWAVDPQASTSLFRQFHAVERSWRRLPPYTVSTGPSVSPLLIAAALSSSFRLEVVQGDWAWVQVYQAAAPRTPILAEKPTRPGRHQTTLTPDPAIFPHTEIHVAELRAWHAEASSWRELPPIDLLDERTGLLDRIGGSSC